MAQIPADAVWEVQTGGSDNNGGGFSVANKGATGTDATYPTSSPVTFTSTLSAVGTTALTDSGAGFTNAMLGRAINIAGQGIYFLIGFTSSSIMTASATLGTFATTTGVVGGAFASPGKAGSVRVASNQVYIKAGTYSITSASTNVAGGCVSDATGGAVITWEGYQTTRGDLGTAPILQASGISTAVLFAVTGGSTAGSIIRNITVDGASLTSIQGFSFARRGVMYQLKAINCTNIGINALTGNLLVKCSATNITGGAEAILFSQAIFCEAYSNTVPGFAVGGTSGSFMAFCLSYSNTGSTSDGFQVVGSTEISLISCVAYANGRDGFRFGTGEANQAINCIAEGNGVTATGAGFNATTAAIGAAVSLISCAAYNNSANSSVNVSANITGPQVPAVVIATSTFFISATNFALNNVTTGGAKARAVGIPGVFPSGTTTGLIDIGAAQSRVPWQTQGLEGGLGG